MTVTRKAFIAGAAGGIASLFLPSLPDAPDTFPLPLGPTDAWGEELSASARVLVVAARSLASPWRTPPRSLCAPSRAPQSP